ncbi:MAG TPA: hypothetical protein VKA00_01515 [Trueperaceae bacterium]|nr:hypothetical protein [Trueperaceae bacterium]
MSPIAPKPAADAPDPLVTALHATPQRMVMAFAGAGAQALARLHAVGGSSRTVLEARDVYAARSMTEWVGFAPRRMTTPRVASAMAEAAWRRARHLVEGEEGPAPVFGVGVSAAIATDRPKKGGHRVMLAVRDALGTASYALTFEKGARDRAGEEAVVTQLVLRAVADACGVLGAPRPELGERERVEEGFRPTALLAAFAAQERAFVVVREDGAVAGALPAAAGGSRAERSGAPPTPVILSGAFNPVHDGHRELLRVAVERVGPAALPLFELPLVNADKSPIGAAEGRRRAQQFVGRTPVVLTHEPLFVAKAELFPGSVFVIGADTAERIVDPRYYRNDPEKVKQALGALRAHGCRLLVAGRRVEGRMLTLADIAAPAGYEDLFEAIPEDAFRSDLSSTQVRRRWPDPA